MPGDEFADGPGIGRAGGDAGTCTGGEHVLEDLARTGRAEHLGVTAEDEPGSVRQRLHDGCAGLGVQLRGVAEDQQVECPCAVLVPSGPLTPVEEPGDGDDGLVLPGVGRVGVGEQPGQAGPCVGAVRRGAGTQAQRARRGEKSGGLGAGGLAAGVGDQSVTGHGADQLRGRR